ncbi:tetraspanin-1-like isoform X2 [Chanodichthys erythropterus]|uniref:tetraspanin-1-like isoform X2 n=1 Tax=Chanodichthys erythropterus TaxID=933992 RepID=UPI00351E7206
MKVTKCLKLVSTFYSFLTLSGGTAVGYGIWSQMQRKASDLFKTVDDATLTAFLSLGAPMLIALGCIFALMGVIGCLGTLKKKSWMLLVFFVVVLIIFILQVIVAVFLVLPYSVLRCCGYKGYEDFPSMMTQYHTHCCGETHSTCSKEKAENKKVRGCIHLLLNENFPISGALSFLIGILEIVALVVSLKVYRCLRRIPDLPDPFQNNL